MTATAKREAVTHLQAVLGLSERRACAIVGADRRSVRYTSTSPDDAELRERLRDLAQQRRRFGYRRLHVLLRRYGVTVNRKRTQRLYREEGLSVRRRKGRRKAAGGRAAPPVLALPNQRWSLDFVHDQFASGRRFRVLNVVDDVTRECLAAVVDTSPSGRRVVRELADLVACRGRPGMIVSDNGTELTRNAVLTWCGEAGIDWHYIAPGKPMLKIDKSFVADVCSNHAAAAIIDGIAMIGRAMNLKIIAEGVETAAQAARIGQLGCHAMQGYLVSRPVDGAAATRLVRDWPQRQQLVSQAIAGAERCCGQAPTSGPALAIAVPNGAARHVGRASA